MKTNSLLAYFDEENQKKFNSHKGLILRELKQRPGQHSYLLADRLQLSNEAVKKRLSELLESGFIKITGTTSFYGNLISNYEVVGQLDMFEKPKKPTLGKWLKTKYPEIYKKYQEI